MLYYDEKTEEGAIMVHWTDPGATNVQVEVIDKREKSSGASTAGVDTGSTPDKKSKEGGTGSTQDKSSTAPTSSKREHNDAWASRIFMKR